MARDSAVKAHAAAMFGVPNVRGARPDGNGRAMMLVHTELCRRARILVDRPLTNKAAYLAALTAELKHPGPNHLDFHLAPFVRSVCI
ncbi:hypothetical protein M2282_005238 [Variovorax boronicumulans]|uniref:hypothetical protein n=1 Tax=Variovorax boronicumulans TaxID=436515 RepID=UPI0024733F8E|nr:hypothetical protein [Variovorax boronicumulans]MDH6170068.1 hypothetical protein [Variovorax boronicumulans]